MTDTSLLPPSATTQEKSLACTIARISDVPVPNGDLYNPAACPSDLLPWLAWAFNVSTWNTNWTDAQKRQAVANSVAVHRQKGTVGALKVAVGALGYDIEPVEWQQLTPQGDPYTFGLNVTVYDVGIPDNSGFNNIIAVANDAKNVRSKMNFLNINTTRNGEIYIGGACVAGETVTINSVPTLFADGSALANGHYHANGVKA